MAATDDDLDRVGNAYLEHLTPNDLLTLAGADVQSEPPDDSRRSSSPADRNYDAATVARVRALRRSPSLVLAVLDRRPVSARILNLAEARTRPQVALFSPFLLFAAAIHRTAADLLVTSYMPERTAPRLRVPVFDTGQLAAYLALPRRRLFLAELLTSFARHSSGIAVTRTARGIHRRRWDELDLGRLAILLEAVPAEQRPGVWRRLGDLALLMSGVYADGAERNVPAPPRATELALRTGLAEQPPDLAPLDLLEWLGTGWYRLAAGRLVEVATAATASAVSDSLRDSADHFHQARRVLNATADRYLYPIQIGWFGSEARS